MPVVKAFVSAPLLEQAALDPFGDEVERACVEVLDAAPDLVQLSIVAAHAVPRGAPVYLEIQFRRSEHRAAPVVNAYMDAIEQAAHRCFGVVPRIRCFAENQDFLHARN